MKNDLKRVIKLIELVLNLRPIHGESTRMHRLPRVKQIRINLPRVDCLSEFLIFF